MLTLGQKQELFSRLLAEHITWLYSEGYAVRMGDVFRDPRVHGDVGVERGYGSAFSCHKSKLAADLNLFKEGEYLTETDDHRASGEKWEERHELCCWGGRFNDGNHYSMTHQGRK